LEEVQQLHTDIRWNIAIAGSGVIVLVLLVSAFVSRAVARPLVSIAKEAEAIRSGDLARRIEVRSEDEVGKVAHAVNELVAKLNADIAQLRKLERFRAEFLGNVSHELRTPLFSLQGYIETLIDGAVDYPAVNRTFLGKALDLAQRLNLLLEDLIDISRIESGEMKMSLRYFRLNEFLRGVVEDYAKLAKSKGITLALKSELDDTAEVFGDKERLRQVMANLVDNAIKYNVPSGSVLVRAAKLNGEVEIAVRNTGAGIAAEHLPRLFERFYRIDKDRSREVGGTGLGLAIVKHILEAHQTSVRVQSEVGKETIFAFTLKI
ncbi:MAG: HAMP domain-containing protein, partial [Ignavibacteriales bacterium]|nr:HAMP domain-containing protein [Ignavibacteriales bacterium]